MAFLVVCSHPSCNFHVINKRFLQKYFYNQGNSTIFWGLFIYLEPQSKHIMYLFALYWWICQDLQTKKHYGFTPQNSPDLHNTKIASFYLKNTWNSPLTSPFVPKKVNLMLWKFKTFYLQFSLLKPKTVYDPFLLLNMYFWPRATLRSRS